MNKCPSKFKFVTALGVSAIGLVVACDERVRRYDACQVQSDVRIVGADNSIQQTDPRWLSTALLITVEQNVASVCTGVVVTEKLLLTAAHCLEKAPTFVLFGSRLLDPNAVRYRVESYKKHPDYVGESPQIREHDIGWVKLSNPLPFSVKPIDLWNDPRLFNEYAPVETSLIGFGQVGSNVNGEPTKRSVRTFISKGVFDEVRFDNINNVDVRNVLLIGPNPNKGACSGDSGGPAFIEFNGKYYVAGLTSFGTKDDCENGRSLYTYAGAYKNFIESSGETPQFFKPPTEDLKLHAKKSAVAVPKSMDAEADCLL